MISRDIYMKNTIWNEIWVNFCLCAMEVALWFIVYVYVEFDPSFGFVLSMFVTRLNCVPHDIHIKSMCVSKVHILNTSKRIWKLKKNMLFIAINTRVQIINCHINSVLDYILLNWWSFWSSYNKNKPHEFVIYFSAISLGYIKCSILTFGHLRNATCINQFPTVDEILPIRLKTQNN